MQIKLSSFKSKKKNAIDIVGKNQTVRIITTEASQSDLPDDDKIYVLANSSADEHTDINKSGFLTVSTTGEYEQKEVFISSQLNNVEKKKENLSEKEASELQKIIDVIEIEIDGVRILYFRDDSKLDKDTLNNLGIVDIMIVDLGENVKQQVKEVSTVDPQVVIPYTIDKSEELDKFKSELEIKFDEEKKYKAKQTDFSSEDYVLSGVILK
jgi:hypothetical protein